MYQWECCKGCITKKKVEAESIYQAMKEMYCQYCVNGFNYCLPRQVEDHV